MEVPEVCCLQDLFIGEGLIGDGCWTSFLLWCSWCWVCQQILQGKYHLMQGTAVSYCLALAKVSTEQIAQATLVEVSPFTGEMQGIPFLCISNGPSAAQLHVTVLT